MFGFVKKAFTVIITFNLSYANSLECVSMNNQECKSKNKNNGCQQ